jgi:hypothetical protein
MLKKDSKGNLAEVNPLRTRKDSIYQKGNNNIFRVTSANVITVKEGGINSAEIAAGAITQS